MYVAGVFETELLLFGASKLKPCVSRERPEVTENQMSNTKNILQTFLFGALPSAAELGEQTDSSAPAYVPVVL